MPQQICKLVASTLIFFFSCYTLSAQVHSSFYTGTIFLKNGQNINGLIKNDPISRMNYKVSFKTEASQKNVTEYDTSNLVAVKVSNGEVYKLLHFKSDDMADSMAVLGKLVVRGKLNLYKIAVKSKTFFLMERDGKVFCLQDDELISSFSVEEVKHNFKKQVDTALMLSPAFVTQINNLSFNEKDFVQIVSNYNAGFTSGNEVLQVKTEHSGFLIFGAGAGYKNKDENEIYANAAIRIYFPRISKGTSVNIGLNYFHNKYVVKSDLWYIPSEYNTSNMVSVPVQVQENLLNKNIRPYLFAGFDFNYIEDQDQYGTSQTGRGFGNNFGIGPLFGAGIEINVFKGLMVKAEYRVEKYSHPLLFGIAYEVKTR